MVTNTPQLRVMLTLAASLGLILLAFLLLPSESRATEPSLSPKTGSFAGPAFLLRFDPTISQFQVITLPVQFKNPHSLAIVDNGSNQDIWFTDPGANGLGRLTYTATNDLATAFYSLPSGSVPVDLIARGEYLWFTAREGNWIGRLEISTTQIVSFPIPTQNSMPLSIDIGSDGSIWFTEHNANQLGRLIVTDTMNFSWFEYSLPFTGSRPSGLAVVPIPGADRIWFSSTSQTQSRVALMNLAVQPPNNFFTVVTFSEATDPSYPLNLVHDQDNMWFTELLGNRLGKIHIATLVIPVFFNVPTANSQPYDIIVAKGDVWFTERLGERLGYLEKNANTPIEYPVPAYLSPIWLQGVAVDQQDKIWLAGFPPVRSYLPAIFKGGS